MQEIVPRIVANKSADEPIRIWSVGCASGEEACTLAMVFAEALGMQDFRQRVKIYATDVDEEALAAARRARYAANAIKSIPAEYQEIALTTTNRRGRPIRCRVVCTPVTGLERDIQAVILVILLMEEWGEARMPSDNS